MQKLPENKGIRIIDIVLLRSFLERIPNKERKLTEPEINFSIGHNLPDEYLLEVVLGTEVFVKNKETTLNIKAEMLGLFQAKKNINAYLKELNVSLKDFVNVNVAGIIYPYLREHILELSIRARTTPVLLPVVNFVRLNVK